MERVQDDRTLLTKLLGAKNNVLCNQGNNC